MENEALARTYRVREWAPDVLLFANLGAVQLNYGYGVEECRRAVEMIGADALMLHLNAIQEAVQGRGNTNWSNLLAKIEQVCRSLSFPVVVKEVGFGISAQVARQLVDAGVAVIDVAGAGGTSWAAVESRRAPTPERRELAEKFWNWGIPTAESIIRARRGAPNTPLIASGGIRYRGRQSHRAGRYPRRSRLPAAQAREHFDGGHRRRFAGARHAAARRDVWHWCTQSYIAARYLFSRKSLTSHLNANTFSSVLTQRVATVAIPKPAR
jgi:hypothetical protein